jgi:hypothetical protein
MKFSYILFKAIWHLFNFTSSCLSPAEGDEQKILNKTADLATWLSGVSAVVIATLRVTHFERIARTHAPDRVLVIDRAVCVLAFGGVLA